MPSGCPVRSVAKKSKSASQDGPRKRVAPCAWANRTCRSSKSTISEMKRISALNLQPTMPKSNKVHGGDRMDSQEMVSQLRTDLKNISSKMGRTKSTGAGGSEASNVRSTDESCGSRNGRQLTSTFSLPDGWRKDHNSPWEGSQRARLWSQVELAELSEE